MTQRILTEAEARAKRHELLRDGYCVIPAVLTGEALTRTQEFTDWFLDTNPVSRRWRFQGSAFTLVNEVRVNQILAGEVSIPDPRDRLTHFTDLTDELLHNERQAQACAEIGLEGMQHGDDILILSKPAHGPALYWHQDHMEWHHPKSALPWPNRVFLSYYLVDTTRHNGCLRVIPGTHRRRIELHDILPDAHEAELQSDDTTEAHPAFHDHPDAVDLPVKAGDLVIGDNRVLHAAWPNQSDQRRPLLLQWWNVFPYPTMPSWWEGEVPSELAMEFEPRTGWTRAPSAYLKA